MIKKVSCISISFVCYIIPILIPFALFIIIELYLSKIVFGSIAVNAIFLK